MTPSDASYQPVKVLQDESSHWYVIPITKYERWLELQNQIDAAGNPWKEQLYMDFEVEFNKYRTGGDLNNIQLFAQL